MNTYKKYCPNVFCAMCEEKHEKGDVIEMETRSGRTHNAIVFNFLLEKDGFFYYSIVREDGFDKREWARRREERLLKASTNAQEKSNQYYQKSNKDADFLSLGEPIKIGHHSEKRHRKIIEQANNNMFNSVKFSEISEEYKERAKYYESLQEEINLSMPESLDYFEVMLEKAEEKRDFYKNNPDKREHSYSLTYATNKVKDLKKKFETAKKLWA